MTACSNTNLCISQVSVSSKQDVDIIRCLSHLLQKQPQLSHALFCIGLEALQVGCHETKFLAFEQHLIVEEMCVFTAMKKILSLLPCPHLSNKQVPHHPAGWKVDYLTVQQCYARLLQQDSTEVTLLFT